VLEDVLGLLIGVVSDDAALDVIIVIWAGAALILAMVTVAGRRLDADAVVLPHAGGGRAAAVAVERGEGGKGEEGDEIAKLHCGWGHVLLLEVCLRVCQVLLMKSRPA